MLLTIKEQHKQIRERIATGAVRTLKEYIASKEDESLRYHRFNQVLLRKNKKVNAKVLKSSPTVLTITNDKGCSFSTAFSTVSPRRIRNFNEEWFEDSGIQISCSSGTTTFITDHALKRAFERALWVFKDKPVEEWIGLFDNTDTLIWSTISKTKLKPDQTCTIEGDVLNAVVQAGSNDILTVLSYVHPTKKV